jgi:phage-related holin
MIFSDDTGRGKKSPDIISIKTNLVSNRMTQNGSYKNNYHRARKINVLLAAAIIAQLLNWRNNMGALSTILNRFTFIANDPETVKVHNIEKSVILPLPNKFL